MDPKKLEQQRQRDLDAATKAQGVLQSSAANYSRSQGVVATIESLGKVDSRTAQLFAAYAEHHGGLESPVCRVLEKVTKFMLDNKGPLTNGCREVAHAKLNAIEDSLHPGERMRRQGLQSNPQSPNLLNPAAPGMPAPGMVGQNGLAIDYSQPGMSQGAQQYQPRMQMTPNY
jgi:hypothetical protein